MRWPIAYFLRKRHRRVAVERLGIKKVLVAERDRVLRQGEDQVDVKRELAGAIRCKHHEAVQVVGELEVFPAARDHGLEPLLDGLLSMEPNRVVTDFVVWRKQAEGFRVALGLAREHL